MSKLLSCKRIASTAMTAAFLALALACSVQAVEIPFESEWMTSGHADAAAEAFVHWDGDGYVSSSCAKCHSTPGYIDFLGADGSEAGVVNDPCTPIGTTVECAACHNSVTVVKDSVLFPSGVEVTGLGDESRCMECHQGRESGVSLQAKITDANLPDDDTIGSLSFTNIHYYAAAATKYGGVTSGGAQYAGKTYDAVFAHVEGVGTCIDCHNPHTLELQLDKCVDCHPGVATAEDTKDIRLLGSTKDYDGDGDATEGIYHEIEDLRAILYAAMQAYASAKGYPIMYDSHAYPYFFNDNGGGANYGNRYTSFTPRLLRAAYNYQVSLKDPGGFAHGGKYLIQLLYDSIEDLDPAMVVGLTRDDAGHFAGSEEPWRHWDEDGAVSSSCAKCHSATGLPQLLEDGCVTEQPVANGMLCSTCHADVPGYARRSVDEVEFPSGAVVSFGDGDDNNLCISCHQGRESTTSMNAQLVGKSLDTSSSSIRFRNVHYFAAGASLFATEVKGGYEYTGKAYKGKLTHVEGLDACIECHDTHSGRIKMETCTFCHSGKTDPHDIRIALPDFDGDGNTSEGLYYEIDTMKDALYAAMQDYATNVLAAPIAYDSHSYPYFFNDTNGNGIVDPDEANRSNGYSSFSPRLVKAAYNYQFVSKDPGSFAHNGRYIIQLLYDGLEDLGTDVSGIIRPFTDPGTAVCGDAGHPYPQGDLNQDCVVNLLDVALILNNWLDNTMP